MQDPKLLSEMKVVQVSIGSTFHVLHVHHMQNKNNREQLKNANGFSILSLSEEVGSKVFLTQSNKCFAKM